MQKHNQIEDVQNSGYQMRKGFFLAVPEWDSICLNMFTYINIIFTMIIVKC